MSMLECPKMCECKDYRVHRLDGSEDMHCFNPTDLIIEDCFNPIDKYNVMTARIEI
jgi:hypothetical protein